MKRTSEPKLKPALHQSHSATQQARNWTQCTPSALTLRPLDVGRRPRRTGPRQNTGPVTAVRRQPGIIINDVGDATDRVDVQANQKMLIGTSQIPHEYWPRIMWGVVVKILSPAESRPHADCPLWKCAKWERVALIPFKNPICKLWVIHWCLLLSQISWIPLSIQLSK